MEIWLDTIDTHCVADAAKTGVVAGVTTNPSILSNTHNVFDTLHSLLDLQPGPVAVQVTSQQAGQIIDEARWLYEFSNRIVIKIPINHQGPVAIAELKKEGIPILGTGILFPTQALLAANHAVAYLSPYFCHMGDLGNAYETLKTIVEMYKMNTVSTKILVASLKSLEHIVYCTLLGVAGITIKAELYQQLVAQQPVVEGFSQHFLSDWMRTHGEISIREAIESKMTEVNRHLA